MAGAMAEMALQRTPMSPFLPSSAALSSRASFSAQEFNHFHAFSGTPNVVLGRQAHKRAGGVHLRIRLCCARASVGEDRRDDRQGPQTFPPPGELQYFGKLSASCVAGALLVKYGSLCVPSVTSPNIDVALVMIATPCLVSVLLLTLASILGSDGNARN